MEQLYRVKQILQAEDMSEPPQKVAVSILGIFGGEFHSRAIFSLFALEITWVAKSLKIKPTHSEKWMGDLLPPMGHVAKACYVCHPICSSWAANKSTFPIPSCRATVSSYHGEWELLWYAISSPSKFKMVFSSSSMWLGLNSLISRHCTIEVARSLSPLEGSCKEIYLTFIRL